MKISFTLSLVLHVGLIAVLVFIPMQRPKRISHSASTTVEPIQAMSVDQEMLEKVINQVSAEKQAKVRAEQKKQKALKQSANKARQQRLQEETKLKKLRASVAQEKAKQKALARTNEKKLAELKQTQAKEQKRLNAMKAQQERLKREAKILAQAAIQKQIDKYKALIVRTIGKHWIIPEGSAKESASKLSIQLNNDGNVLDVKLIQSSGDSVLDRSAIAAVYKASPLPVPEDPTAFAKFRQFHLTVRPEEIL